MRVDYGKTELRDKWEKTKKMKLEKSILRKLAWPAVLNDTR